MTYLVILHFVYDFLLSLKMYFLEVYYFLLFFRFRFRIPSHAFIDNTKVEEDELFEGNRARAVNEERVEVVDINTNGMNNSP